jgi:hypothetical protein
MDDLLLTLTENGAHTSRLEKDPVLYMVLFRVSVIRQASVLVVSLDQIHDNSA